MENEEWKMKNGEWEKENEKLKNGKWRVENGEWENKMGIQKREINVFFLDFMFITPISLRA